MRQKAVKSVIALWRAATEAEEYTRKDYASLHYGASTIT